MDFYKKLYSNDTYNVHDINKSTEIFTSSISQEKKLNKEKQELCEKEITIGEVAKAIKELPNNKSPGSDGFSADFYKFFWLDIKDLVFNSIKYGIQFGMLSIDQKRAVLSLNPKKGKNIRFLKT